MPSCLAKALKAGVIEDLHEFLWRRDKKYTFTELGKVFSVGYDVARMCNQLNPQRGDLHSKEYVAI